MMLQLTHGGLQPICTTWEPLDMAMPMLRPRATKPDSLGMGPRFSVFGIFQVIDQLQILFKENSGLPSRH